MPEKMKRTARWFLLLLICSVGVSTMSGCFWGHDHRDDHHDDHFDHHDDDHHDWH